MPTGEYLHIPSGLICTIVAQDMFTGDVWYGQDVASNRMVVDEARQFAVHKPELLTRALAGGPVVRAAQVDANRQEE